MLYSIDRFEGDTAVILDEDERIVTVLRTQLPPQVKAGDMLRADGNNYVLDTAATQARREKIRQLQDKLRRRN